MRQLLLTAAMALCIALPTVAQSALHAPEGFTIIEDQPEGELRIYNRSGNVVKEEVVDDDTNYITTGTQDGTINIVFADDGSVYFQRPVSESYYDGWVKGTISSDGKTITVPVGQYTAYTKSFDMAVQVWMMLYDEQQDTYIVDESVADIIYAIDSDGTIRLQGTDQQHVLGCVNRCFGSTFSYLDFEWHNNGSDYETVYTLSGLELATPPAGLQTQTLFATTGMMDGIEWDVYNETMNIGFDGDDVWLQGFTDLLPQAWVKGHRDGNTITFPTGQVLGSYFNKMVYMVGAKADAEGNPIATDIVFTYDGNGTYTSYTDMFVSSVKDDIAYIIYYMGMTLSDHPDQLVEAPTGIVTEPYTMEYQEPDVYGRLKKKTSTVQVGFDADRTHVYLQGITPLLLEAYIVGAIEANASEHWNVVFTSPQFLGTFTDEESGEYPIFFQAYNGLTGDLLPQITFAYDPATRIFSAPTATIGIGINKTGLLGLQNMYYATLTPDNPDGIGATLMNGERGKSGAVYDLNGRRVLNSPVIIKDGRKVLHSK